MERGVEVPILFLWPWGFFRLLDFIDVVHLPADSCLGTVQEPPTRTTCLKSTWQYTSNLYRSTPPICNAVPCWLLSSGERETQQYTSNLYRSTPPICTAVRLPFVPAILLRKYHGLGFRKVPDCCETDYVSV